MEFRDYKNIMSGATQVEDAKTKEEIDLAITELETACYTPFFENLVNGFIYPSDQIFDTLEFFSRIGETKKVEKCAEILNKYYVTFLTEKFDELILNEKYELCAKIKNFVV